MVISLFITFVSASVFVHTTDITSFPFLFSASFLGYVLHQHAHEYGMREVYFFGLVVFILLSSLFFIYVHSTKALSYITAFGIFMCIPGLVSTIKEIPAIKKRR